MNTIQSNSGNILKWPRGRLDFSQGTLIMGILNVTADSFSDGGKFLDINAAVEHAAQMTRQGAAVIDIGAESTRPGAKPVDPATQIERTVPVILKVFEKIDIPISIDAYNPQVAAAAIEAGAAMINDITALADDRMAALTARYQVPVILVHMQGTPDTMQKNPTYHNVVEEVLEFLLTRAEKAQRFGIPKHMIFIDPGIGFGKTTGHNLALLNNLGRFVRTGYRVLLGASRKRFIGDITARQNPSDRVFGTAATTALAATAGVSIVRVHDIAANLDAARVAGRITRQKD
ncbi:MAG: dihydropteroate synthase [Planctomycetota bacterium]